MIAFPATLRELRDAIDSMIEATGSPDTPIGRPWIAPTIDKPNELDEGIQVELVYIDEDYVIVGDEANDYRARPRERMAVVIL